MWAESPALRTGRQHVCVAQRQHLHDSHHQVPGAIASGMCYAMVEWHPVLTKWHVLCHDGSDLLVHGVADAQTIRCIARQGNCADAAKDDEEDSPGCHAAACSQVGHFRARHGARPG